MANKRPDSVQGFEGLGDEEMDFFMKEIRNSGVNDRKKADQLAQEVFGILKKRSPNSPEARAKIIKKHIGEILLEISNRTEIAPAPSSETVRVPSPIKNDQDKKTPEEEEEETVEYSASTIAKVLSLGGEPTVVRGIVPSIGESSSTRLIEVIQAKNPNRPETSGLQEVAVIAKNPNENSTALLLAEELLRVVADEETPAPGLYNDTLETDETQVIESFSVVCNNIGSLKFLNEKTRENIFRNFIINCEGRTNGEEEMREVFNYIKVNFEKISVSLKELFIELLVLVIDRPGKDKFVADKAKKGSGLGAWKKGINIILEELLKEIDTEPETQIIMSPNMNPAHALRQASESNDYEKRYFTIMHHLNKIKSPEEILDVVFVEYNYLDNLGKEFQRDVLYKTLELVNDELAIKLDILLLKIKLEENKKVMVFPPQRTTIDELAPASSRATIDELKTVEEEPKDTYHELPVSEIFRMIDSQEVKVKKKEEEKGVLTAFLNKYRGKLAFASGVLALIGIVSYSGYNFFGNKKQENEDNGVENASLSKFDSSKATNSAMVGAGSGISLQQVQKFNGFETIVSSASLGASGVKSENEKTKETIEQASELVASSQVSALKSSESEYAEMQAKVEAETKAEWSYQVEAGDTFFGVVENWKSNYNFAEMREKYSFLNKIDNWDLSVAMRMIFNAKNNKNRDLDIYKGSDKEMSDTFEATPYEIFMEIFKFKKRGQRNFVKKYMENGGDFETVLESIERGYFENEDGGKVVLQIEAKKKFQEKKTTMMKRYHKRRGAVKNVADAQILIDSIFKFANSSAKDFVMDKIANGETLGNISNWIKQGYAEDNGNVIEIAVEIKKTRERKEYKLDTGFGVIRGKKAINDYKAGLAEAEKAKNISRSLQESEKAWKDIDRDLEIKANLAKSEEAWQTIGQKMEIENNLKQSESDWNNLLAEKEMEESWEMILDTIEIKEDSIPEISEQTSSKSQMAII